MELGLWKQIQVRLRKLNENLKKKKMEMKRDVTDLLQRIKVHPSVEIVFPENLSFLFYQ